MFSTGALLGVYLEGHWFNPAPFRSSPPDGSWSGSARWAAALAHRWCLPTWHCLKFPHDLQHFFLPKKNRRKLNWFWKTPKIVVFFSLSLLSPLGEFELKRDYLVGTSPGRSELWHRFVVVVVNGRWGPTVWPMRSDRAGTNENGGLRNQGCHGSQV